PQSGGAEQRKGGTTRRRMGAFRTGVDIPRGSDSPQSTVRRKGVRERRQEDPLRTDSPGTGARSAFRQAASATVSMRSPRSSESVKHRPGSVVLRRRPLRPPGAGAAGGGRRPPGSVRGELADHRVAEDRGAVGAEQGEALVDGVGEGL